MKRIVAIIVMLIALVGVGVFAQDAGGLGLTYQITAWTHGTFLPFQIVNWGKDAVGNPKPTKNESQTKTYAGVGYFPYISAPHVGVTISASTPQLGFWAELSSDPGADVNTQYWGLGTVWAEAKPLDWIRLRYGRFYFADLAGKVGTDGIWSWYSLLGVGGYTIFSGMGNRPITTPPPGFGDYTGVLLTLNPIKPLTIAATMDAPGPHADGVDRFIPEEAVWMYQRIQVAAGFEIDGIGLVRAQYVGDYDHVEHFKRASGSNGVYGKENPFEGAAPGGFKYGYGAGRYDTLNFDLYGSHERRIEAAFALTMLDNIIIDVGGKLYLPIIGTYKSVDYSFWHPGSIAAGARVTMGAFDLAGNVEARIFGQNKFKAKGGAEYVYTMPFGMDLHLTPTYDLGFIKIGADIGWGVATAVTEKIGSGSETEKEQAAHNLGFGLNAELPLGTGSIGIGAGIGIYGLGRDGGGDQVRTVFNLPIFINYYF